MFGKVSQKWNVLVQNETIRDRVLDFVEKFALNNELRDNPQSLGICTIESFMMMCNLPFLCITVPSDEDDDEPQYRLTMDNNNKTSLTWTRIGKRSKTKRSSNVIVLVYRSNLSKIACEYYILESESVMVLIKYLQDKSLTCKIHRMMQLLLDDVDTDKFNKQILPSLYLSGTIPNLVSKFYSTPTMRSQTDPQIETRKQQELQSYPDLIKRFFPFTMEGVGTDTGVPKTITSPVVKEHKQQMIVNQSRLVTLITQPIQKQINTTTIKKPKVSPIVEMKDEEEEENVSSYEPDSDSSLSSSSTVTRKPHKYMKRSSPVLQTQKNQDQQRSRNTVSEFPQRTYLPVRIVSTYRHVVYGPVKVIATWFYIDHSIEEYPYRYGQSCELFTYQTNPKSGEPIPELPGKRVCVFHVIESVEPKTCPLQHLVVGCWFSSFSASANAIGNTKEGWDAWNVIVDMGNMTNTTTSSVRKRNNVIITSTTTSSVIPRNNNSNDNHTILLSLSSFLAKKHQLIISNNLLLDDKIHLDVLGPISCRNLLASLCVNECDEHTCHVDMIVLDPSDLKGGSTKTCPHGKNTAMHSINDDTVFYKDHENRDKKSEGIEEILDKQDKQTLTKHLIKLSKTNQRIMKTVWGHRIIFDNITRRLRSERLIHPRWFKELFHQLTFLRIEKGLVEIIPYRMHHIQEPMVPVNPPLPQSSFIDHQGKIEAQHAELECPRNQNFVDQERAELEKLSVYFECDYQRDDSDQHILFLSMYTPRPIQAGNRYFVTKWKLKQKYVPYVKTIRPQEDLGEDFYDVEVYGRQIYVYVPIHENVLRELNMIHHPDIVFTNLEKAADQDVNGLPMQNLRARRKRISELGPDHPDSIRYKMEINDIENCLYGELSLWNGIHLPSSDEEELKLAKLMMIPNKSTMTFL